MRGTRRQLVIDGGLCIGCRACAAVCPAGLITRQDAGGARSLSFAAECAEECDLCSRACPTGAVALPAAPGAAAGVGTRLEFLLAACRACGAPVETVRMMERLRAVIAAGVQADAAGEDWLGLCPGCRQVAEAREVAREAILVRRATDGYR